VLPIFKEIIMSNSILVTYATRYNATREVAEKIAAVLSEHGLEVVLLPTHNVRSLESYRAVVLGAPLYIGSLLKGAQRFLEQHQAALAQLPAAFFALGPTRPGELDQPDVRAQLDEALAKIPWFKPVSAQLFGGKYDPARLRFPDSLLAALPASPLHNQPASDARDWNAINAWAESLVEQLQPAAA
jgi:menaquinone-dependent protoporphyrinogen oxidase